MLNLIKLELKKNNIRIYLFSAVIITVVMIGFLYLFAAIPLIEPNSSEATAFSSYTDVMGLTALLNMVTFCVLSAVMYSRFIIGEYTGKRALLLFSYPVSRKKVFLSKIMLISIFTIGGLLISNLIIFTVFAMTESVFPLVKDTLTSELIIHVLFKTVSMAVLATGLGIIAMGIGFGRKSVPVTIVSAVILCSLISNMGMSIFIIIAALIAAVVSAMVTSVLLSKVNCMEV